MLWYFIQGNKKKKPPKKPRSLLWAYHSIAKLGGWADTKRTGRVGWLTVWEGWFRLQERLEGYMVADNVS